MSSLYEIDDIKKDIDKQRKTYCVHIPLYQSYDPSLPPKEKRKAFLLIHKKHTHEIR